MSHTIALVLPLPVAIALAALLLVLAGLSALALSLRKPLPVRSPELAHQGQDADAGRAPRELR